MCICRDDSSDSIAPELLKKGYQVIATNYDYVYLDCGQPGFTNPGGYWWLVYYFFFVIFWTLTSSGEYFLFALQWSLSRMVSHLRVHE